MRNTGPRKDKELLRGYTTSGRAGVYSQAARRYEILDLTQKQYVYTVPAPFSLSPQAYSVFPLQERCRQTDRYTPWLTDHPCCKCRGVWARHKRFPHQQAVVSAWRCSWSGLGAGAVVCVTDRTTQGAPPPERTTSCRVSRS